MTIGERKKKYLHKVKTETGKDVKTISKVETQVVHFKEDAST